MVAISAFMNLSEHIVGVFLSYAFKDGCKETSFIKGPSMNGEPSRPRPWRPPLDRSTMFRLPSSPRWGPSSSARTLPGTLLHRRQVSVCLDPPVMLLLAFLGHLPSYSLPLRHA